MKTSILRKTAAAVMAAASMTLIFPSAVLARDEPQELVIFGDSLSDTGNRFLVEGSMHTPPYDLLAAENYVPSLPYAIGGPTFTNGAVWVEHFARAVSRGGVAQAALRSNGIGANYAYAGARASNTPPLVPNDNRHLVDQVNQYLADVNGSASAEAIHVVFIGGNDIAEALGVYVQLGPGAAAQVIENAVTSVAYNVVVQLYGAGARRFLIVTSVNPGVTPRFALNQPAAGVLGGALADAYNGGLQVAVIEPLQAAGAEVYVLNGRALFDDILENPAAYGIQNTTDRCVMAFVPPYRCARPDRYVYWDNFHPTARVHQIIGQAAIGVVSP